MEAGQKQMDGQLPAGQAQDSRRIRAARRQPAPDGEVMSCQGERRESRIRPAPGSSPHGRLRRGPDLPPRRESLRQWRPHRFAKTATHRMEALRLRFLRQAESIPPMAAPCRNLDGSRRLPPGCCRPSLRTRREARILPIVGMSSDRLFLDRVGRHQSPSLLHRQDQTTNCS